MKEMTYKHPYRYKGEGFKTEKGHGIFLNHVEANCFRCEFFMGRDHDFDECRGIFNPYDGRYMRFNFICTYDKKLDGYSKIEPMHKYDYDKE